MPGIRLRITHLVIAIVVLGTIAVTLLATATPQLVYGATCTWNGNGGDSNWSTADNWDGCAAPGVGDLVVFPDGAGSTYTFNDLGTISLDTIDIQGTGYELDGGTIEITNAFNVTGSAIVYNPVTFAGNGTQLNVAENPAQVNFESPISVGEYAVEWAVDGAAILQSGASLSGTADSVVSLIGSSDGYVSIYSDNESSFFGVIELTTGHLQVYSPNALGDALGETYVIGGIVELAYGGAIPETFALDGGIVAAFADYAELSGVIDVVGPVALVGDPYVPLIISGEIAGPSNYYTYGTVEITGVSTNDGQMELCCIAGNILTVTGTLTSGVLIQNGSDLLTGSGSVGWLDFRAGELRPGMGDPGTFTVNGDFTADNNVGDATYFVEIYGDVAGTEYDQLVVGGSTVALGSSITLDVNLGFIPNINDEFVVIDNQGANPTTGTFAGIDEGDYILVSGNYFRVNYNGGDGNDVVLTRENPPNDPPVFTVATVTSPINEGGQTALHLEWTDANELDDFDIQVFWQVGSPTSDGVAAGVYTYDVNHTYPDNGSFDADIQVFDGTDGDNVFRTITVNNVAPTITGLNISGSGATKTISGNIVDPGLLDTFTVNINWNDGSGVQSINRPAGATSFSAEHTISGAGSFTVNVTITDKDGGSNVYSLVTSVAGGSSSTTTTTTTTSATTTSAPPKTTPAVIPVTTPTGGTVLVNNQPEFTWTIPAEVSYTNVAIYMVQLTDEEGNALVEEDDISEETITDPKYLVTKISDTSTTSYTPPQGLILGSYRWVVVAEDDNGEAVATSPINEFRIATDDQVNDIETENGEVTANETPQTPSSELGTYSFLGVNIPPETQEVIVNTPAVPAAVAVVTAATVAAVATNNMVGVVVGLFLPRRRKHWGVIYEENSPVAFSNVKLSQNGQLLGQSVSDLDGKYGFLVEKPGDYQIAAEVSGYSPANTDVHVDSSLAAFADISLAKGAVPENKFRRFVIENRQKIFTVLRWVLGILMVFGLIYTFIAFSISPTIINLVMLTVYFVLSLPGIVIVLRNLFSRSTGKVVDAESHHGLGGVSVRLQGEGHATIMTFTNLNGEMKVNFPAGKYQAFITKPGYELVGGETTAGGVKMVEVTVGEDGNIRERIRMRRQASAAGGFTS